MGGIKRQTETTELHLTDSQDKVTKEKQMPKTKAVLL